MKIDFFIWSRWKKTSKQVKKWLIKKIKKTCLNCYDWNKISEISDFEIRNYYFTWQGSKMMLNFNIYFNHDYDNFYCENLWFAINENFNEDELINANCDTHLDNIIYSALLYNLAIPTQKRKYFII